MTVAVDLNDLDRFASEGVPHEWLKELRAEDPVYWHPGEGGDGFWLITLYEDVISVSRDWRNFSSQNEHGGVVGLNEAQRRRRIDNLIETSFVNMDPPEHTKYRNVVQRAVFPRAVAACEPFFRQLTGDLLDKAIAQDVCMFVTEVSMWLPIEMMAELGKIPTLDRELVLKWVNAVLAPDDPAYAATPEQAVEYRMALQHYCKNLYEIRKKEPGEDIISLMIEGKIDDEPITADHAAAFFAVLLGAASETTRTAMSHGVHAFAQFPDQYDALRNDPSLIPTTIEEILRWSTPINYMRRGATADFELRGRRIKRGDSVVICYASANRDENVFVDPFRFDITRQPNRHLSFGGNGPHNCLGTNVARIELKIFLEELIRRVSAIEIVQEPKKVRSNFINGLKDLPIRFHPTGWKKANGNVKEN